MKRQYGFAGALLAAAAAACVAVGCEAEQAQPAPESTFPQEFLQAHVEPQELPVAHVIRRDYRLREGDFLEIIYHVRHRRNVDYRIKIQDIIVIRFPFNPSLNQTEQVQSDGTLHLDLVGSVPVFDKTIDEVHRDLQAKYAKFLKDPILTVSFKQSNVKIAELKEAITTSPRGQSRLVPIAPDGGISLPFIVDVRAAGLTIGELHRALNQAYTDIGLRELEVTVNLQTVSPLRVYVLGEVRRPGVLLNRTGTASDVTQLSLLQALAQAGGPIPPRAELSRVVVIRRANLPSPQAAVVNVYQLLENHARVAGGPVRVDSGKYRHDIWLDDGDVVYVPTSDIARRADYIEYVWTRGIRAISGFTSYYGAVDDVDWLGPNP
jgi:polysaccharide export outer membrane protein